jgi:hypothetical protein
MTRDINQDSSTVQIPDRKFPGIHQEMEWLSKAILDMRFGEVGLVFVVHDGKVVRVKKLTEESSLAQQG